MCSPALTPAPESPVLSMGGGAGAHAQSPGSRDGGEGHNPGNTHWGLPHPLSPKEMRGGYFHFRFLESPWALWHLESDPPPTSCPMRRGWGRTWHWLWDELWPHQVPGHSQKGGVSPGQAPIWESDSEGDQRQSVEWSLGGRVC